PFRSARPGLQGIGELLPATCRRSAERRSGNEAEVLYGVEQFVARDRRCHRSGANAGSGGKRCRSIHPGGGCRPEKNVAGAAESALNRGFFTRLFRSLPSV